jgi:hypothetical protein
VIASFRGSGCCRRRRLTDQRGIALAIAVFALAVIGALVGGTFFAGRLEQQSGRNAILAAQAGEVAEAGLSDAIATITAATLESLPIGGAPLDIGTLTLSGGVSASRWVTRLTDSLFLIRVRGIRHSVAGTTLAERSLGLLVRLGPLSDGAADFGRVTRLGERSWVQLY